MGRTKQFFSLLSLKILEVHECLSLFDILDLIITRLKSLALDMDRMKSKMESDKIINNQKISDLNQKISILETDKVKMETKITTLENEKEKMKTKITTLENDKEEMETKMT